MAQKPSYNIDWATNLSTLDVEEPPIILKQTGITMGAMVGRQHYNYQMLGISSWINWIKAYAMDRDNNLSDLASPNIARINLGLDNPTTTINCNSKTSTEFQLNKKIKMLGDVSGEVLTKFVTDTEINITLANTGVTSGTYTKVTTDSKGRIINAENLNAQDVPELDASKITSGTLSIPTTGNANTATKLQSPFSLTVGSTTKQIDGSVNITFSPSEIGSLESANKLTTVRKIGLIDFDGTQDVPLTAFTPIGYTYIQFPNTLPPSNIFGGGTWVKMFDDEGVFFRTEGGNASEFVNVIPTNLPRTGIQPNGMPRLTANFKSFDRGQGGNSGNILNLAGRWSASVRNGNSDNWGTIISLDTLSLFNSKGIVDANEIRPDNRTFIIWRRIA